MSTTAHDLENLQTAINTDLLKEYNQNVPHIIKYMGSKRNILSFVITAISDHYERGHLCDLFAGTSILSGALSKLIPMHSNDIQEYSSILSKTYFSNNNWENVGDNILEEIIEKATKYVQNIKAQYPELVFTYSEKMTIPQFVQLEKAQQALICFDFGSASHHLFIKNYSGTYWSFDQCLWIDAIRHVAEEYSQTSLYYIILSSLMYAMSYNSQSTGHYAQYRDATSKSSKSDILIYRQREILPYFKNKFEQLKKHLSTNRTDHIVTSLDYSSCLDIIEPDTLVYADPPYAFVHYSRFYHALETLVKYDYPEVLHKGRYRPDRHQSPFCKRTEVNEAFTLLFEKIREKRATLILSYSNTGMISLDQIKSLAAQSLGSDYEISVREEEHTHSTMGRKDDKSKEVQEYLIIAKKIN
jgi:adenine-specific DNA-methyltransferase